MKNMKGGRRSSNKSCPVPPLASRSRSINKTKSYAYPTLTKPIGDTSTSRSGFCQIIDVPNIMRHKYQHARYKRTEILKAKRAKIYTNPVELMKVSTNTEDFICYVATDSESDKENEIDSSSDQSDSDMDIDEILGSKSQQTKVSEQFKSSDPVIQPHVADNGYHDDGDPSYMCDECHAYMWFGERQNKRYKRAKPIFTLCCHQGKVKLPLLKKPPNTLLALLYNGDDRSKHFREFIRAYNMMFSFTSLGGKVNHSINNGKGPYCFQLCGQNYHLIGDMLPGQDKDPAFMQLYIFDTLNEASNRIAAYGRTGSREKLRESIVELLKKMLDNHNPHVKAFRSAGDRFVNNENTDGLKLVLTGNREKDGRTHNLPTVSEVAALIPGDFSMGINTRDIVLESRSGKLQRISELHPAYLPLQYPLLFPYGEDGFRLGIDIGFVDTAGRKRTKVTMREFFAFRIQERLGESPTILMSGKLYQQFLVDVYPMIETNRLSYLWLNQSNLRSESYDKIVEFAEKGDGNLSNQGKRIIIPSSFTGGARYMMQHYLDAMATCKYYGFPDLFITITCNPKWPEITRFLQKRNLKPEDRPDITCRIFKIKLDNLIHELTNKHTLGVVNSAIYTIEFQKRGLPHAHIVLFLHPDSKLPTGDDIDKIISAEIPDREIDPHLYEIVGDVMIHGPCGAINKKSVCMKNGACTKFFPKSFSNVTKVDENGYPVYKRRDDKRLVHKKNFDCDNKFVIPYNRDLMLRYRAHINVEWCNQTRAIKYLFKYIHKGPDYIKASVENEDRNNEIKKHYNCRYISACEATWRILAFSTQYRTTAVEKLSFHLPGQQMVIYTEDDPADEVVNRISVGKSKFLAWMEANKKFPEAKNLTYADFPKIFVWHLKTRSWELRKRGFAIGRITYVPPSLGEAYYLRVLLNVSLCPKTFEDIRTFKGIVYPTFQDACYVRGLLDDDRKYIDAIKEASYWGFAVYIRRLFVIMLLSNSVAVPLKVWNATWKLLSEDVLDKQKKECGNPELTLSEAQIKNYALAELEKIMRMYGSSLSKYNMPLPDNSIIDETENTYIRDETSYNQEQLRVEHDENLPKLTDEQKKIYQEILFAVNHDIGGMFFVYGFGGTGKTFLWSILGAAIRSRGQIVLNVASSGIAALLLQGGRTAHSRFGIPIVVNDFTTCSMKAGTHLAELIKEAKLIIWDEAPMMSKYCFETLDRSMRDILRCDKPFGGKVVVFGGDFRQVLPVIPDAGRVETVMASLNSSTLWKQCKVLKLTKNLRLLKGLSGGEALEIESFSKWILDIGDGKINESNDGEVEIDIPEDLLITNLKNPVEAIVKEIYGESFGKETHPNFFKERAILTPTNQDVSTINEYMLSKLTGDARTYLSSDSVETSDQSKTDEMVYSQEFLNSIKLSGLPNHELRLKVGAPIMLLRNIDPKAGLCNGTRLHITQMADHVIEARVITGDNVGDKVLIPRMILSPTEAKIPFRMRRRQFPVTLAFAMTINKSQGQTLKTVGLFLPRPVFSHGQLYVAVSRVTTRKGLKILITDKDGHPQKTTKNVVYTEVFENV